jgi:putative transposase
MKSFGASPSVLLIFGRSVFEIFADLLTFLLLCFRSSAALAAENLFLRKQLGLYVERKTRPRRATDSIRFTLARVVRNIRAGA